MRRWIRLALAALLILVVSADWSFGQSMGSENPAPTAKPQGQSFIQRLNPVNLFGSTKKPSEPAAKTEATKTKQTAIAADEAEQLKLRATEDYLRRLAVCDEIQSIALRNSDDKLHQEAQQLRLRIFAVYQRRFNEIDTTGAAQTSNRAANNDSNPMPGVNQTSPKRPSADNRPN